MEDRNSILEKKRGITDVLLELLKLYSLAGVFESVSKQRAVAARIWTFFKSQDSYLYIDE